jgi:hypothetical protein
MDYVKEVRQHLQKVKNIHEQVFYFHAHTYYDHNSAEKRQLCWDFCEKLKDAFKGNPHVEVHTFQETAVSISLLLPTECHVILIYTRGKYFIKNVTVNIRSEKKNLPSFLRKK